MARLAQSMNSAMKSRSETASRELSVMPPNSSSLARNLRSMPFVGVRYFVVDDLRTFLVSAGLCQSLYICMVVKHARTEGVPGERAAPEGHDVDAGHLVLQPLRVAHEGRHVGEDPVREADGLGGLCVLYVNHM